MYPAEQMKPKALPDQLPLIAMAKKSGNDELIAALVFVLTGPSASSVHHKICLSILRHHRGNCS